jgi:hypothetical protein
MYESAYVHITPYLDYLLDYPYSVTESIPPARHPLQPKPSKSTFAHRLIADDRFDDEFT